MVRSELRTFLKTKEIAAATGMEERTSTLSKWSQWGYGEKKKDRPRGDKLVIGRKLMSQRKGREDFSQRYVSGCTGGLLKDGENRRELRPK